MALLYLPIETLLMVGTFLDEKKDLLSLCLLCRSTHAIFIKNLYRKLSGEVTFPFHWAVKRRNLDLVRYLLDRHKTDINAEQMGLTPRDFSVVDKYDKTILAYAVENGSVEMMKLLLRQPEIHAKTQTADAEPLLWLACRAGQRHMVEYLQQEMIDINQRGPTGTSSLQVTINMDHFGIFCLLLHCGDKLAVNDYGPQAWAALTFASAGGKHEMVRRLLDHPGIDVNTTDDHGRTPLWWAAAGGHADVVGLLHKHPLVKKRWKDCTGKTAYAIAKDRGHGHVTIILRAL